MTTTDDLTWKDSSGNHYVFYSRPMIQAASFILVLEACERLAFYGIMPILTTFLKEQVGMSDASASAYNQLFQSMALFTPIVSSIICDVWLGPYRTILIFSIIYTLGLILLCASTVDVSDKWMVHLSFMGLIALGTGGIKAAVNICGAQQFHPEKHKNEISSYYTYFYASINIGALIGGISVPITLQETSSFFAAFIIPVCSFIFGVALFLSGSRRLVRMKSQGSVALEIIEAYAYSLANLSFEKCKESNGGKFKDKFIDDSIRLLLLFPLFVVIIPFNIAYGQMTTSWITQGLKMNSNVFGWDMPSTLMQNVDSIGILVMSAIVDGGLYRYLRARGKMPSIPVRFFIGSLLGLAALLCSFGVEKMVMNSSELYVVSIWWQVPQYFLIAAGEIFLFSSAYEVAYTDSPDSLKVVASALCLLFMSVGNLTSGMLFKACSMWLPDFDKMDPSTWQAKYDLVHYDYFFLLLGGVCLMGAVIAASLKPGYDRIQSRTSK